MFSLFRPKYKDGVLIVSEPEFWKCLERECTDREYFDAQGDEHGEIDLRLVGKIEGYLVPKIGQWENTSVWFHQMDFYGDGIRSLIFTWSYFKRGFIEDFQSFLVAEHKPFCILLQFYEADQWAEESKIGSLAIFSDRLMVSRKLAQRLTLC